MRGNKVARARAFVRYFPLRLYRDMPAAQERDHCFRPERAFGFSSSINLARPRDTDYVLKIVLYF